MCLFPSSHPGSILKKLLHTGNSLKVFLWDDAFIVLFTWIPMRCITVQFSIIGGFQLAGLRNVTYTPFNHKFDYCNPGLF